PHRPRIGSGERLRPAHHEPRAAGFGRLRAGGRKLDHRDGVEARGPVPAYYRRGVGHRLGRGVTDAERTRLIVDTALRVGATEITDAGVRGERNGRVRLPVGADDEETPLHR